jgi:hypothetical protein
MGCKHSHGHLLWWEQVYLSAYLGCALVVEACLRVVENPKQERPCGRLKAEIRPLVSLPTAKPLGWFYTSCQESHTLKRVERTGVSRTAPKGDLPTPWGWKLSCGVSLQHPGLRSSPRERLVWEVTV